MRKFLLMSATVAIATSGAIAGNGNKQQIHEPFQPVELTSSPTAGPDLTDELVAEDNVVTYVDGASADSAFYTLDKSLYIYFTGSNGENGGTSFNSSLAGAFAFNPPFYNVKLTNRSTKNLTSFSWAYDDYTKTIFEVVDGKNTSTQVQSTSDSKDLEFTGYANGVRYKYPTLTSGEFVYDPASRYNGQAYFVFGGKTTTSVSEKNGVPYYACPVSALTAPSSSSFAGWEIVPDVPTTTANAKNYVLNKWSDAENICIAGVGQLYPTQPTNYYFDEVLVKFTTPTYDIESGASVHASIYAVADENPNYIENKTLLAEGNYTFSQDFAKSTTFHYMTLKVRAKDPITGLYSEGLIVPANTRILIVIDELKGMKGFKLSFWFHPIENDDEGKTVSASRIYTNNSYIYLTSDKGSVLRKYSSYSSTSGYPYNPLMAINAQFDYIHSDTPELAIPLAGGSVTAKVASFYSNTTWDIDEDLDRTGTIDGWLKYSIANGVNLWGKESAFWPIITFEAPKTTVARKATMTLYSAYGGEFQFIITQGDTGVDGVTVETVAVKTVNGNFEIMAPATVSNVTLYNVAGQIVANHPVTPGENTIDGSALANGIYILKFDNGYTVKAVK